MRDIKRTLELCAAEDTMDYCPEFDGVKSILEYCDRNVKPFKKLCFRSGNDTIVNDLVRRFEEDFMERQLIDPDTKKPLPESMQKMRKILVFFLANTDATYKYNMHDDTHLAHVFEICPLMPKFLTVTLVWELQLDQLFYEMLAYTPCWFSFQYFEAASESLKYIDDAKKILLMLENIFKSLLISIERSSFLQMDIVDQKIIYNKMHDQAIILLRRFNTPDASKLDRMKKNEQQHYWGYSIKHLLQMVLFAFDLYESKFDTEPQVDISIFKIGAAFQKNKLSTKQLNEAIQDEKLKIINALLGTLQNCVMNINMTSFIEWVEVDLTPRLTLQQAVGELAYEVRQRIGANAAFEHGVGPVLATIEIRPKSLEQILSEATIGDILRTLDDSDSMPFEETKMWYNELFKRGTAALENSECLETITEHLKFISKENCMQIMECIKLKQVCAMSVNDDENDEDNDDGDENEELMDMLQTAVLQLSNSDLIELLEYRLNLFGDNARALSPDSQQLEQRVTEFLNKCTTTFELNTFLILCLQDPIYMWSKFLETACHVKDHVHNFCDAVAKTLPASLHLVDKVLKNAVLEQTRAIYFPKLLAELYFLIYQASKTDFLAKFLNGHLTILLEQENFESLLPLMNALEIITTYNEKLSFGELTAPMLAMVSNVAECARWTSKTFESKRVQVLNVSINFIKETLQRFLPGITEKDRKWLTSVVKTTCGSLNQYYFQELSTTGEKSLSLDVFLLPDKEPNDATVVAFLRKIILRCSAVELVELISNKLIYKHAPTAFLEIAGDINYDGNKKAALNFRYSLNAFLNYVNSVLDENSKDWALLLSVFEVIAAAPKDHYEQIFMEAECFLQQLTKTCIVKTDKPNSHKLKDLKEFVETKMADCTAKSIFLKSIESNLGEE